MKIIKSNTYNVVNTEPFDIPLPLKFELMYGNGLLASYTIHEDGRVDYSFSSSAKEPILTSTARPLELNDIYFLFSSRVFQDKTPFTELELARFGLDEYNPYEIARKTHGIMPIDRYWIKFQGDEDMTYKKAERNFSNYYNPAADTETSAKNEESSGDSVDLDSSKNAENPNETILEDSIYCLESILEQKSNEYSSINDVGSILNENKLDLNSVLSELDDKPITESAFASSSHQKAAPVTESKPKPESSGGNLSPDAIAALLAESAVEEPPAAESKPEPESSGGNLSPDAIAALLAESAVEEPPEE
ncbi:MAG: hypothetical protein FWF94_06425 [Oscillospiraceae bacterium]|nr:hypothetical protein [Oscillospiraceae bacterium]